MAMTEEERRKARNEASKRWYAAHKAAKKAAKKAAAKPEAKKVEAKPAAVQKRPKPAKDPNAGLQKQIDKLIKRGAKPVAQVSALVKEIGPVLAEIYKTGDEKFVKKSVGALRKAFDLGIETPPDGKGSVTFVRAKAFRCPKAAAPEPVEDGAQFVPFPAPGDEQFEEKEPEPVEIPVDPAKLDEIPAGGGDDPVDVDVGGDGDEDPFGGDEDEDKDPDEDGDEDEDEDNLDEDWANGRAEMMGEIDAQGGYDD